jgi:sulfur carrier protein
VIIYVNERQVEVDEQATVATLLQSLGYPDRGVAVALDLSVLHRSDWSTRISEFGGPSGPLRFEVVTAVQGG